MKFDATQSEEQKEIGMARAAAANKEQLSIARQIAKELALATSTLECNADMVQEKLIQKGIDLGNAAGSIFRGNDWQFTGRFVKSERVHAHANLLRVWKFVGAR